MLAQEQKYQSSVPVVVAEQQEQQATCPEKPQSGVLPPGPILPSVLESQSMQRFIDDTFEIQVRSTDREIRATAVPEPSDFMMRTVKEFIDPKSWYNYYGQHQSLQRYEEPKIQVLYLFYF